MKTKDLARVKKLITKYKGQLRKRTICENFGQSYVTKLEDNFSLYRYTRNEIWELIRDFDNWCMNYTG